MKPILALWTAPRSRSTAFERMMQARGDFHIMHEPFTAYYYLSSDRRSQRLNGRSASPEHHYTTILRTIHQNVNHHRVFIKDMAYYIAHIADSAFVSHFENTFLIRHPAQALPSLFHIWPNATIEEAGYAALYRLFTLTVETSGRVPIVLDAEELVNAPGNVVQAYCNALGIPFIPDALAWQPPWKPASPIWSETWHAQLVRSRGFDRQKLPEYPAVQDHPALLALYEACLPYYDKLYEHCLRPDRDMVI